MDCFLSLLVINVIYGCPWNPVSSAQTLHHFILISWASNDLSNSKASSKVFNFTTSFINSVSAGLLFTYASNNHVASDLPFSCSNKGVTAALNRGSHSSILLFGFSTGITNCVIPFSGPRPLALVATSSVIF